MSSPLLIVTAILLMFGVDAAPQPSAVTQCAPVDLVFLLDTSKGVRGQDFDKQLEFANGIVDRLDVGPGPTQTRVGVISIGYTYLLQFYLRTHKSKEDVKRAISNIKHRYSYLTNTGASIRFLTQYMFRPFFGGRPDATRVAIVITDGLSQDRKSTRFEALLARKKGIKMFAIGVGMTDQSELVSIGNQPTDDYVFMVDSFDALPSVVSNMPKSSCEVAALTKQRPAPTKRFTLAPLIFNKFVPPKTRAPETPALSSKRRTYKTDLLPVRRNNRYLSKIATNQQSNVKPASYGVYPATNPPSKPAPTTRGLDSTYSTTNPPSTPAPTTRGSDSTSSTTNPPSTPAPTTRGSDSTYSTTNPPSTPAPTTRGSDSTYSTTNPPSTPAPIPRGSDSTYSTTNPPSTPAPTTRGSDSTDSTTNPPSTPAPTTRGSDSTDSTTNPTSTPALTTRGSDSTDSTTNPTSTPAPMTRGSDATDSTTHVPSTPAPTTRGSDSIESTTHVPSTPAPTTHGSDSTYSTTKPPSTPEPTTRNAYSSAFTTVVPSIKSSSTGNPTAESLHNPQDLVSDAPYSLEIEQSLEDLLDQSQLNEPVEINNAPTKTVSETRAIDYGTYKPNKKYFKKKRKGNDVSNVITNNKYKWGPAPRHKMAELQYDDTMENDRRIWSMMMGSTSALDNLPNKLSRDVAIADEPKQYCGGKNADVFFALDSSNSIWPEDFKKQLQFVTDLIDTFDFRNNKTRVGIIVYSSDVHMKVALQSGWTKEQIKRQISNIEYVSGLTNTSDAIRFIRTYGFTEANEREDTIKIAIILTDGISRDPLATKHESVLSREEGIKLFAIGIGKDIQLTELKRIANDPDDKYVFNVSSFDALASIRSLVAVSACGVVPDQPSNLLYCGANSPADIIFVYDAPGLGARKARLLTSFVHDVKRGLQTAPNGLRIGRRSDNCPSNSNIDLTTDTNLRGFDNIQFPGIETLLGQLRMVFPNRLDAKNLAIVFVDESTQNIELATRVLKGDINFHVMVVAIGDPSLARLASDLASFPHNDYLVNIPSYMSLGAYRYEFLQKLCYLITNEPMYLRDARVRETRSL